MLRIIAPEGEGVEARNALCDRFCNFLASQEGYMQAFNQLPQHQQIIAILIQEEWEDQPNLVKDHYLRTSKSLWTRAIVKETNNLGLMSIVLRETRLRHMVEFFIAR